MPVKTTLIVKISVSRATSLKIADILQRPEQGRAAQTQKNLKRPPPEDQTVDPVVQAIASPAQVGTRKVADVKGKGKAKAKLESKATKLESNSKVSKKESNSTQCPFTVRHGSKAGSRCVRLVTEKMKAANDFVCHNHKDLFRAMTEEERQAVLTKNWEVEAPPAKRLKLSDTIADEEQEIEQEVEQEAEQELGEE